MTTSIRKKENFHILLWLIKDLCWVSLSKTAGMIMIGPTVGLALYIAYINRKDRTELVHNLAVSFWIMANSIWMIGEFYFLDQTRSLAIVFFILGLLMMVRYYSEIIFSFFISKKKVK